MTTKIEYRVRFIFKNDPFKGAHPMLFTYNDSLFGATPDGAASDPWLMSRCIVWVETRTVVESKWSTDFEEKYVETESVRSQS